MAGFKKNAQEKLPVGGRKFFLKISLRATFEEIKHKLIINKNRLKI